MKRDSKKTETRCIHAGNTVDPVTGAVMPAIVTSSTFENAAFGEPREYIYSRGANPTRAALERCAAELEGGVRAFATGSGMAATAAVIDLLPANSHVVVPNVVYGGTWRLLTDVRANSAGVEVSFADFSNPDAVAAVRKHPGPRPVHQRNIRCLFCAAGGVYNRIARCSRRRNSQRR